MLVTASSLLRRPNKVWQPNAVKVPPAWVLVGVFCGAAGFTLIFAFAFHLGLAALLPGALILAYGVFAAFRAYLERAKRQGD